MSVSNEVQFRVFSFSLTNSVVRVTTIIQWVSFLSAANRHCSIRLFCHVSLPTPLSSFVIALPSVSLTLFWSCWPITTSRIVEWKGRWLDSVELSGVNKKWFSHKYCLYNKHVHTNRIGLHNQMRKLKKHIRSSFNRMPSLQHAKATNAIQGCKITIDYQIDSSLCTKVTSSFFGEVFTNHEN